jgi:pSer/pThr/pTyr-binding forkhead associated (FHA) protein
MSRRGAPTGKWPSLPPQLVTAEEHPTLAESKPRLVVRRPDVPEVVLPIQKPEFLIGRLASEVDLALDDELVSRRHARLIADQRGYFRLEDLGSRNGISYLGRFVRRLNLVDGDEFEIGKTRFVFRAELKRYQLAAARPEPPRRSETVFGDVDVPRPRAPVEQDGEDIGWDPERARRQEAPEEPAPPAPADDDGI